MNARPFPFSRHPRWLPPCLAAALLAGAAVDGGSPPAAAAQSPGRQATRRRGEPAFFQVNDDDAAMAQASRQARRTVRRFIAALNRPAPDQRDFAVKKTFREGGTVEHIWLTGVTYHGGRFHGTVDNRSVRLGRVKVGDRASVNPDEIADWAYVDHGKLVGGYTVRVLFTEINAQERQEIEQRYGFHL